MKTITQGMKTITIILVLLASLLRENSMGPLKALDPWKGFSRAKPHILHKKTKTQKLYKKTTTSINYISKQ